MIEIKEEEQHGFEPPKVIDNPQDYNVLNAQQVLKILKISKQALYDLVEEGRIPAYYWGHHFTKLYLNTPELPIAQMSSRYMVFLENHAHRYVEEHPEIGGLHYQLHGVELEATQIKGREMVAQQGYVSFKELSSFVIREYQKNKTVAIPAVLKIIDDHGWPIMKQEQDEIDTLLDEGQKRLSEMGFVHRGSMLTFMQEQHGKDTRYYPVIKYIAEREGWPMKEGYEEFAKRRRRGEVTRHKPRYKARGPMISRGPNNP